MEHTAFERSAAWQNVSDNFMRFVHISMGTYEQKGKQNLIRGDHVSFVLNMAKHFS